MTALIVERVTDWQWLQDLVALGVFAVAAHTIHHARDTEETT
jgi:hypothetical protein